MFNFVFGFGGRILVESRELIETCGTIEGLHKHKWYRNFIHKFASLMMMMDVEPAEILKKVFILKVPEDSLFSRALENQIWKRWIYR
jgi:hypothetical protein